MDLWGHLVWMSILILLEGLLLAVRVGIPTAFASTISLACMEHLMFSDHVQKQHQEHPLHMKLLNIHIFHRENEMVLWVQIPFYTAIVTPMVMLVLHGTFFDPKDGVAIVLLHLFQGCISSTIHAVQHGKSHSGLSNRDLMIFVGGMTSMSVALALMFI